MGLSRYRLVSALAFLNLLLTVNNWLWPSCQTEFPLMTLIVSWSWGQAGLTIEVLYTCEFLLGIYVGVKESSYRLRLTHSSGWHCLPSKSLDQRVRFFTLVGSLWLAVSVSMPLPWGRDRQLEWLIAMVGIARSETLDQHVRFFKVVGSFWLAVSVSMPLPWGRDRLEYQMRFFTFVCSI